MSEPVDLHERLTAEVAKWREWCAGEDAFNAIGGSVLDLMVRALDHADDVLARHPKGPNRPCRSCVYPPQWPSDPCHEVRSIANWLLGDG